MSSCFVALIMCWAACDAILELRLRKSTLARIWRSKAEIFTLYLWNLYITVCQSYLSYTNQFHSISSSANRSICPSRSFVVACFTRSGVMEMRASKSCFNQITPRRSSVCGISWFSSSGHKEQKRKICIFCRDRIQLQRRCETLEVCCTDFLEILTYCCCRSYCLNFSHTIKQKFKHCCISNDSLITQARTKRIWLKENLGTEEVLGIYNRMTPQGFQEVPISPQWWYYRRYTYQLYTL